MDEVEISGGAEVVEAEKQVEEHDEEKKAVEINVDIRDRFTLGAITAAFAIGLLAGAILEKVFAW